MIAIDTNVLLRYLLQDDEIQSERADKLVNGAEQVLLTDVVITEAVWTLTGKKYNIGKDGVIQVINSLFEESNIIFEDGQVIWRALNDYRQAKIVKVGKKKKGADFPDALIINKSKAYSVKNKLTFNGIYTFDVAAREIDGTKEP